MLFRAKVIISMKLDDYMGNEIEVPHGTVVEVYGVVYEPVDGFNTSGAAFVFSYEGAKCFLTENVNNFVLEQ